MEINKDIFSLIKESIVNLDEEQVIKTVNYAINQNFSPQNIIEKGLAKELKKAQC